MIRPTISLINDQQVRKALRDLEDRLKGPTKVLVGVPKGAGVYEDGMTIATIAAVNEFGAENIQHKGGVAYGYKTEKDAEAGNVRFMKAGEGFMELGKTKAHTGSIPARPFLQPGVANAAPQFTRLAELMLPSVLTGEFAMRTLLEQMGNLAEGSVKQAITDMTTPPNARSTVAKKSSDHPLIDTGNLRQSIRYVVDSGAEPIEEGL